MQHTEAQDAVENLPEGAADFARATLDALSEHLAVLDAAGTIVNVNKAWRDFAESNPPAPLGAALGRNYLAVCDKAAGAGSEAAAAFAAGIRAVINNQQNEFSFEYFCHSPSVQRWFIGRVTRLPSAVGPHVVVAHENITARRQVEEKLKQSEEWLRAVFAASRDGILIEHDELIVYVNESYTRLFGYERPEELIGRHISIVLSSEDERRMLEFGRRRVRGKTAPPTYEFKGKRKDGALLDLEASVSTPTVAGQAYVTTMIREISERKRAEEALRGSEARYRLLFDSNPLPMWVYDLETLRFIAVNEAAIEHYGYSREEFLGMTLKDIRPPEDVPSLLDVTRLPATGLEHSGIWRHRKKDGSTIHVEITSHALVFEGRRAEIVLANDVTERRSAEEALRKAHDELEARVRERTSELVRMNETLQAEIAERRLAESAVREHTQRLEIALYTGRLGSWELDLTTHALESSGICKANFGLPPEADLSYQALFDAIHSDDRSRVRAEVERVITEHADYDTEYRNVWPDGSTHWIIARGRCSYDSAGRPLRMMGVTLDITERKEAEEARRDLLRRLVAAQEEERRRISRELHDQTGQHITALSLELESLKEAVRSDPDAHARLQRVQGMTNQLGRDVHTLAWELRPSALDDFGLHTAVWNYAEDWSQRCGVPVDFHSDGFDDGRRLPPELETTLYRVVQEAFNNVLRHAGGARRVSLILERRDGHALVIIEDDGRGFAFASAAHSPAAARRLGLLGMRERVELIGGTIEVESALGKGTTIFVRIPAPTNLGEKGGV
ncbi:MAG: PAS domain S-box protein [Pyrinomonadaceae bacterium]